MSSGGNCRRRCAQRDRKEIDTAHQPELDIYRRELPILLLLDPLMDVAEDPLVDVPLEPTTGVLVDRRVADFFAPGSAFECIISACGVFDLVATRFMTIGSPGEHSRTDAPVRAEACVWPDRCRDEDDDITQPSRHPQLEPNANRRPSSWDPSLTFAGADSSVSSCH